jgi:hypothetical protein
MPVRLVLCTMWRRRHLAKANDEIVVMAMIETKEGLAELGTRSAPPRGSTPSTSGRLIFSRWEQPRGDNLTRPTRDLRQPDPRCGTPARHQGRCTAGRVRRSCGRVGEAGFDMVMLTGSGLMIAGAGGSSTI